jgi:hypothetical protein
MKPAASHSLACRFGIFIIAFHDSIPANDDFTKRLTILWNIVSFFIDHPVIAFSGLNKKGPLKAWAD